MATEPLLKTDTKGYLPLIARGKVRDVYEIDSRTLLFVATDRISAFDVIMDNVSFYPSISISISISMPIANCDSSPWEREP